MLVSPDLKAVFVADPGRVFTRIEWALTADVATTEGSGYVQMGWELAGTTANGSGDTPTWTHPAWYWNATTTLNSPVLALDDSSFQLDISANLRAAGYPGGCAAAQASAPASARPTSRSGSRPRRCPSPAAARCGWPAAACWPCWHDGVADWTDFLAPPSPPSRHTGHPPWARSSPASMKPPPPNCLDNARAAAGRRLPRQRARRGRRAG